MKTALAFGFALGLLSNGSVWAQVPRDTPPPAIENAQRERALRETIAAGGATADTYVQLAGVLVKLGRPQDAIDALRSAAALDPTSPEAQHRIAVYIWEYVQRLPADAPAKPAQIRAAIDAEDRALAIQSDYVEAMVYKNILLRTQANLATDPIEQKRLVEEADLLRNRAMALQRARAATPRTTTPGTPPPPPPPAPPFAGFNEPYDQALSRYQPLRIGGPIKAPTKIRDVKPAYPPEALAARVNGVVIIEAIIDESGTIANARILRSIPLLDNAALSAVSQWQFTPTELNGRPVPVVLTVTVNFTSME